MKKNFYQIRIDFEYLNEIYTINSEPYNTLFELKESVSRKIFPFPGSVHCFYKNIDLSEKEDDEIAKIFPNKTKIKIKLKRPQKDKSMNKPILNRNSQIKLVQFETLPNSSKKIPYRSEKKSNTILKKVGVISLPSIIDNKFRVRQSQDIFNNLREKFVKLSENNVQRKDIFNLYKNDIEENEKLKQLDKSNYEREIKSIMNKNKVNKNSIFSKDKKMFDDISTILYNLKAKNLKENILLNNNSLKFQKSKFSNNKDDKIINSDKDTVKQNLKQLNISSDDIEAKINNINNTPKDKDIIDENYICNSCKNKIIYEYCLNCNEFKCNSCIELCKENSHERLKIELNDDFFKNISSYGELIISNIDDNLKEVKKYNKELKIYDIKKHRDILYNFINDILNIYNEVITILENTYKEKSIKKEMEKYEIESNKIKNEINEILHKANSYLKNDVDISKPKYKMMNMKYFFDLLNEKGKSYQLINQNVKIYSLNSIINSNIDNCFNEMENLMKSLANIENPFLLKGDLNKAYHKLLEKSNTYLKKDRKKLLMKRRSIQLNAIKLPVFSSSGAEKTSDITNSKLLDLS